MNEILIRPLTKDDVYSAAEIRINGWKEAYRGIVEDSHLDSLNIDKQILKFEKYVGNENFIVAIENDKVVGFCRFTYDNSFSNNIDYIDCELNAIYVHPDYKGKGIGTKMFRYVLDKCNNKNKKSMIIWCLADNTKSINFYKHMGGEIKEFKMAQIGDKDYKEVGIVYNINELCNSLRK